MKRFDPRPVRLFRDPKGNLRLTILNDRSYLKVKVVKASPLSHPNQYICLLDGKDEEIGMVHDLRELDEDSRRIAQEELEGRYLGTTIRRIQSIRTEFGTSYWDVETDRGVREFVVKSVQDNILWLEERRLLVMDVDSNRFEVEDYEKLDRRSVSLLETVL